MFKIAYYEIIKIFRNYRLLAILVLQPIILITLLGLVNFFEPKNIQIGVVNLNENAYAQEIINNLENDESLKVVFEEDKEALLGEIKKNKYRSAVILSLANDSNGFTKGEISIIDNQTVPEITLKAKQAIIKSIKDPLNDLIRNNIEKEISKKSDDFFTNYSNRIEEQSIKFSELTQTIEKLGIKSPNYEDQNANLNSVNFDGLKINIDSEPVKIKEKGNAKFEVNYFDFTASAVIILIIVLISLNISSTTITSERSVGTFERLFAAPFRKYQFIGGKMIAYLTTSLILTLISIAALTQFFNVHIGNIYLVLLLTFATSVVSTALGILISSLTYSIAESVQISAMVFLAILITTQFLFQIESMHPIMKYFSAIIPFTYAIRAMREVNILQLGFLDIYPTFIIMALAFIGTLFLSTILLKTKSN